MSITTIPTRTPLGVSPESTDPRAHPGADDGPPDIPAVDVVIPVYNEQLDLERGVLRLYAHMRAAMPYTFRITIADNASTDLTWEIACRLAREVPGVRAVHLSAKGRGRALREVWSDSDAAVLAYMDVDLSTDLAALLPLLAPLLSGHSDIAIGTRLSRGSHVVRGAKREFISRSYNVIVRGALGTGFSDAQCGFKAIRADAAAELLPLVEDGEWFFDTELLVLAERSGMRIHEVPVDWVDDPGTTVDIVDTARKDLAGIWRLARGLSSGRIALSTLRSPDDLVHASGAPPGTLGQLGRFAAIGVLSTVAYAILFWLMRTAMSAPLANALALLITAIGNTAANRWFTFGVRGRPGRLRHQAQGLVVLAMGLVVTSGSLLALWAIAPDASRGAELAVLTAANVVATLLRFLLFRVWVFGSAAPIARPTAISPTLDVATHAQGNTYQTTPERTATR